MAARKVVNIGIQHGGDGDVRVASGAIVGGTVNVLSPGSAASPDSGAARAAFREKLDAEDKAVAAAAGRHRDLIGDAKYASNSVAVLVIGNESYLPKSKLKSLAPWVSEDVELVVTFFRSRPGRNTILPPVPDCEQGQILAAMRAFVEKAKACDACVVYYTGHGLEGVLVEIGGSHVSRDDVISVLANDAALSGKPKVFIFDCCSGNNAHAVAAGAAHSAQKREHADVLVVEAADPDFMSYKGHEDGGSVLTAILFNELRAMAGSDLVDVLACAKPKVSQYVLNNVRDLPPGNYYQTMHVALNTLTKKLVLPH